MDSSESKSAPIVCSPVTPSRWRDLETLFGERGACAGCWCMYWRATHSEYMKKQGEGNRKAMRKIVNSGRVPGILAYAGKEPIGWCSIEPRERFVRLETSRVLAPVDNQSVWSVNCFFIARAWRRKGVSVALLRAAVEFARKRGPKIVEGYPVDSRKGKSPDAFVWTGLPGTFLAAGFKEVARRSPTRPIYRRTN
jgi:GNAT superfamily N-acetyltransferase